MLNAIVVNFKDTNQNAKFPKGHLAQINRKYKNTLFNQNGESNLSGFRKISIHQSSKISRNLFKRFYKGLCIPRKRKSNTFDGFIGFSNNETKK
jgi:hypothetical protein